MARISLPASEQHGGYLEIKANNNTVLKDLICNRVTLRIEPHGYYVLLKN